MPPPTRPSIAQVLLHGTTLSRARKIVQDQAFNATAPLFVVIRKHRDLAVWFARRKAQQEHDSPAIVVVSIDEKAFERIRRDGHALLIPFDENDDPTLRSRNQWRLSILGIQALNRQLEEITSERVTDPSPAA